MTLLSLTFTINSYAVVATIYIDTNSNGAFDVGESDNDFINGNGGLVHNHAFDVDLPGNPATSEIIVDFDYVDNSMELSINGANVCAPALCQLQAGDGTPATQTFLSFATGDYSTPWLPNNNGLPRLRVTISETSITFVGTRTTGSTVLEPIIFTSGGVGSFPVFVQGQNTVVANNIDGPGPDGMSGSISATFDNFNPSITILKNASPTSVSSASSIINYSIPVTNSGDYEINGVVVNDSITSVTCPSSGNNTIATLAVGATENCSASYVVTQSNFDNAGGGDNDIDNTVSVTGTSATFNVADNASAAVTLILNPSINVTKVASPNVNVSFAQTITYTYEVTNDGNLTISNVSLNDVHLGSGAPPIPEGEVLLIDNPPLGDSIDAGLNATWDTLAPNDVIHFTSTYNVTQSDIDFLQ